MGSVGSVGSMESMESVESVESAEIDIGENYYLYIHSNLSNGTILSKNISTLSTVISTGDE
jgi:hypothetical protein